MEDKICVNTVGKVRVGMSASAMKVIGVKDFNSLDYKTCSYCKTKYEKISFCQKTEIELNRYRNALKTNNVAMIGLTWANKLRKILQHGKEAVGVFESYSIIKNEVSAVILEAYREELRITLSYLKPDLVEKILKECD